MIRLGLIALLLTASCQPQDDRTAIFDGVCDTIRDTYFDPTFGGLDWDATCERFRPQAVGAASDDAFYDSLNAMLHELNVSHTGVGPLDAIGEAASPYMFSPGSAGIDVRLLDGRAVITRVLPGSTAHEAGLRPGTTVTAIDGTPVAEIVDGAKTPPPRNPRARRFHQMEKLLRRVYGPPGTTLTLTVEGGSDSPETMTLERAARPNGRTLYDGVPQVFLETESRIFEGGVGYLRFNGFQPEDPVDVLEALDRLRGTPALVIDLRGNNGGATAALTAVASRLTGDRFVCGAFAGRERRDELVFEPRPGYSGPIAVLVDEMSVSAAELLPACLQAAGRATIVGNRTPGMVVSGSMTRLSDDVAMVSPDRNWVTRDGTVLEGVGVTPDLEVPLDRASLLAGADPQLEAAIERLLAASNSRGS